MAFTLPQGTAVCGCDFDGWEPYWPHANEWVLYQEQVKIQDFAKGGSSFWDLKLLMWQSGVIQVVQAILWPGSRAYSRALEALGFLMLKYTFSHIVETLFSLFLTTSLTPKSDKNNIYISHCTSINLRYFYAITPFANLHFLYLHGKLCLWLFDLEVKCQVKWG